MTERRVLFLQLARLGDILQTLPAVQAYRRNNPKAHISFLCRTTFADAARLSPFIDELIEFPSNALELAPLSEWLRTTFHERPRFHDLINLTFSESSAYLAALIPAENKRGLVLDKNGSAQLSDLWSQYFFATVLSGDLNSIHLNDLFCRIAGFTTGSWPLEIVEPPLTEAQSTLVMERGPIWVGVQLSSSQYKKTLDDLNWNTVLQRVVTTISATKIVFFGSEKDLSRIEALRRNLPENRAIVAAGKYRFHENVHLIKRCHLILAPDTAINHFASIVGTRVVQISMPGQRPQDTGPYGNAGHDILSVHNATAGEIATAVCSLILGQTVEPNIHHATTRLLECTDRSLRNEIDPQNYTPAELPHLFSKIYYLLGEFRCAGRLEDIPIPKLGTSTDKKVLKALSDQLLIIHDALQAIFKAGMQGQNICLEMLEAKDRKAGLTVRMEELLQMESLLMRLHVTIPLLRPLIGMWKVTKDSRPSESLEQILEITEAAYRELSQNTEIILDLLQAAVESALPASEKKRTKARMPKEQTDELH